MADKAPSGEAASYYQENSAGSYQIERYQEQGQFTQQPPQYGANPNAQGVQPQSGEKVSFDQAFKIDKPKYNDLWAGVLFIAVFLGFTAVSGIAIQGYASTKGFNGGGIYDGDNDFGLDTNTIVLFVLCLLLAFVLSYGYIWLARAFTKKFIYITGILNIIVGLVTALYMLYRRYWSGGIMFLLFTIFTIVCFISWRKRIPFSVLMLQTAIDVSKTYGHVYTVSAVGGLAATAFGAWFMITMVAVYVKYQPGNNPACSRGAAGCSSAKVIGLLVFITFAAYWITEVIKNVTHVTVSGVYGSWYFCKNRMPSGATRGAFKRSMTYSFGSISFGSLIVAIINFLRQMCSAARRSEAQQGNIVGVILFCVLGCVIAILDWAVQFLNRYAFSHIALYGKSYIAAAKDTWIMIKDRGIDALINECLIGPVFSIGALFIAYTCALLAYLYLLFTSPEYNRTGDFTPVVVAFAFLIGMQMCHIFTTPLSSGIDTIFVACAWDPEVLMRDHPDLYQKMVAVYPHVQTAIHA